MTISDIPPPRFTRVREVPETLLPALVHPFWRVAFPWLVQGTTTRGAGGDGFDLGLFSGGSPDHVVRSNWDALIGATGSECAVHARQVHEATVRGCVSDTDPRMGGDAPRGLTLTEPCDGHVTRQSRTLVAVSVADCVPVFFVDPEHRAVGAIHAGWRGAAAGVLEAGVATMVALGTRPPSMHVHLGPSICGECYEVGPEVFDALGQGVPEGPTPIDLRTILAVRAVSAGIDPDRITISEHCTRCTGSNLYSHRGGDAARQVGYLGVRG